MFKYTKTAIDIVVDSIKRYCNIFKYGTMIFTFIYFGYSIYVKMGNVFVNCILLGLFSIYMILDSVVYNKKFKTFYKMVRRSYKGLKFITKTFSLGVMIYSIYTAANNVSPISIILATLMIVAWVMQLLLEIAIEIFDDKRDLIIAGWNKDIEDFKKPVTTVSNFIKKVKGEDVEENNEEDSREIKILKKKMNKDSKLKI